VDHQACCAAPMYTWPICTVCGAACRPPTDPALMSSFLAAAKGSSDWQERLPPLYIHAASGHPLSLHHTAQQRPHWGPSMYSAGATPSDTYTGSGYSGSGGREGYIMDRCAWAPLVAGSAAGYDLCPLCCGCVLVAPCRGKQYVFKEERWVQRSGYSESCVCVGGGPSSRGVF
jgi:hypothetical protein